MKGFSRSDERIAAQLRQQPRRIRRVHIRAEDTVRMAERTIVPKLHVQPPREDGNPVGAPPC